MGLSIVWLALTVMFCGLGVCHWRARRTAIPELRNTIGIKAMNAVTLGASEFVAEVSAFVKELDARLAAINRFAAIGYFVASGTALLSAVLACPRK